MKTKLTDSQKKAVLTQHSRTLVSAGAGTGKTRVIVERIHHLIVEKGVRLSEMLVLTFTEKAANELKRRLLHLFQEQNLKAERQELESAYISTFHSFASRLLKEHPIEAGVDPDFRVLESQEADFLKEDVFLKMTEKLFLEEHPAFLIYKQYGESATQKAVFKLHDAVLHHGGNTREYFEQRLKAEIDEKTKIEKELISKAHELAAPLLDDLDQPGWDSFLSNTNWTWETYTEFFLWLKPYARKGKPREAWKAWRDLTKELAAFKIWSYADSCAENFKEIVNRFSMAYAEAKSEKNALDFDDLQIKAVDLFQDPHPACQRIREKYGERLKYVFIDEFQDTNRPQVEFAGALKESHKFLVGDYKQSIYGFRGAEPAIFFDLSETWDASEHAEKVSLVDNFRTCAPLLDFINQFFQNLWAEDEFHFDALVAKGDHTDFKSTENVELIAIEAKPGEGEKDQARFDEATHLANRLREIHEAGVSYGEMTILFEAMTQSHIYEYALREQDIPYVSISGSGFYQQAEIKDMLCFLEHLDNPYLDIPLAAVLRSPFCFLSDDALYYLAQSVKSEDKGAPLYRSIQKIDQVEGLSEAEKNSIQSFVQISNQVRIHKDQYDVAELLQDILRCSDYELWALSQRDGVRKFANLKKLVEIAREAEAHEKISLHQFIQMMKRLQLKEVRESMAQIDTEESGDAVRLMTVHASKGLEFSVVAIADMGHEKRGADSKVVLTSSDDGFAIRLKNEITGKDEKHYFYNLLDDKLKAESVLERKRLLYVAMTRAKHKLILSGVYTPKSKEKQFFSEMQTWMEWTLSLKNHLPLVVPKVELKQKVKSVENQQDRLKVFLDFIEDAENLKKDSAAEAEQLLDKVNRLYPGQTPKVIDLPVSAYMSYLKNPDDFFQIYKIGRLLDRPDEMKDRAKYETSDFEMHVADIGTAVHGILEVMDFKSPDKYYDQEYLENFFYDANSLNVAAEVIEKFVKSSFFDELKSARTLTREAEFVYNARHGLIYGAVDALVQNDQGEWAVVDYKTSEGDEQKTKKYFYDLQIQMYALAAKDILKIPVTRGVVYYLKNQEKVEVEIEDFAVIRKKVNQLQSEILDLYYSLK